MSFYDRLAGGHILTLDQVIHLTGSGSKAFRVLAPTFITGEAMNLSIPPESLTLPQDAAGGTLWETSTMAFYGAAGSGVGCLGTLTFTPAGGGSSTDFFIQGNFQAGGETWLLQSKPVPPSSGTDHTLPLNQGDAPRNVVAASSTTAEGDRDVWGVAIHPTLGAPFFEILNESAGSGGTVLLARKTLSPKGAETTLVVANRQDLDDDPRRTAFWITAVCQGNEAQCAASPDALYSPASYCKPSLTPVNTAPASRPQTLLDYGLTLSDFRLYSITLGVCLGFALVILLLFRLYHKLAWRATIRAKHAATRAVPLSPNSRALLEGFNRRNRPSFAAGRPPAIAEIARRAGVAGATPSA